MNDLTLRELAAPRAGPLRWVIEVFGPQRCMFESNVPDEKRDLFHDTAARTYLLPTLD